MTFHLSAVNTPLDSLCLLKVETCPTSIALKEHRQTTLYFLQTNDHTAYMFLLLLPQDERLVCGKMMVSVELRSLNLFAALVDSSSPLAVNM